MISKKLEQHSSAAAVLLIALANQKRLMIVAHLFENELSVGNIAQLVNLSQSALSQHLAKLRKSNIVETRREGQTIYYSAKNEQARLIVEALSKAFVAE